MCAGSLPPASKNVMCLWCHLPNDSYFLNNWPLLRILVVCPVLIMMPALWGRKIVKDIWKGSARNKKEIGNLFSFALLHCHIGWLSGQCEVYHKCYKKTWEENTPKLLFLAALIVFSRQILNEICCPAWPNPCYNTELLSLNFELFKKEYVAINYSFVCKDVCH